MRRVLSSLLLCGLWAANASAEPVLYDFYADWCGPCRSMAATVDRLAAEGYAVQRVNVDRQPELAAEYRVQSIPCFVWVDGGREVDRVTGVVSVERLRWQGAGRTRQTGRTGPTLAPHPAWRYERAEGRRASVVRIFCEEAAHGRSIGSGTLVRWNGRVVVLTARHVVHRAVKITVELCTGKNHAAKVLATDPTWDCAVLELMGRPVGVPVAEIELGPNATQENGDRLESCGYGPDGRLAVNSGLFLGYRRSTAAAQGPDDWMVISGRARPGDSGGPVFNARGRLVGVLWGTDGEEVVCVQAGRLHVLLEAAVPAHAYQPQSCQCDGRCPTPPLPGLEAAAPDMAELPRSPTPPADCQADCECSRTAARQGKEPALPWRREETSRENAWEARVAALQGQIAALQRTIASQPHGPDEGTQQRLAALEAQLAQAQQQQQQTAGERVKEREKSPGNMLEQKLDDFLHKLPVQGPVTKLEEKQLESEHPLQRFFGATAAIILLTVLATVAAVGALLLCHKIYQAAHAHKAAIDAGLASLPVVGTSLAAGFDKVDALNAGIDAKVQSALSGLQSQLANLQAQVTKPAATTPAPNQSQAGAPPVAQS